MSVMSAGDELRQKIRELYSKLEGVPISPGSFATEGSFPSSRNATGYALVLDKLAEANVALTAGNQGEAESHYREANARYLWCERNVSWIYQPLVASPTDKPGLAHVIYLPLILLLAGILAVLAFTDVLTSEQASVGFLVTVGTILGLGLLASPPPDDEPAPQTGPTARTIGPPQPPPSPSPAVVGDPS